MGEWVEKLHHLFRYTVLKNGVETAVVHFDEGEFLRHGEVEELIKTMQSEFDDLKTKHDQTQQKLLNCKKWRTKVMNVSSRMSAKVT